MELQNLLSDTGEFETPDSWLWVELGELVASIQTGFPCGQHNQEGVGIPHLRPMNVSPTGEIDLEQVKYVEVEDYPNLEVGDVLFNNTNSPTWLGKTATIHHENNWTFSNHMTRIRFYDDTLEPSWVGYYLHYLQMVGFFKLNCAHHINQASINTTFLANDVLVPLPPVDEQTRIVEAIEALFSRLDAGIAALQRVQKNLNRYKASVLKAACEGQLVPQNPDDEPASELLSRILDERRAKWEAEELARYEVQGREPPKNWRNKYQEPQPPDTSDLPELPEGWVWTSLEQCSWDSGYGTSDKCDYEGSGPPVLRIPNVSGGKIDLTDLKYALNTVDWDVSRALEPNDLLVIRTNGSKSLIGRSALVREVLNELHFYASYLIRFRLIDVEDVPEWIATIWDSQNVRDWIDQIASTSAGQYNVNTTNLNKTPIPLPPSNYQAEIMDEMGRIVSVIEQVETTIDTAFLRAERLRQSILKDAFVGRLVPQDPDDEPASALLERIRAEREQRQQ